MDIGIIGGGWRADFFMRIAKQLPGFSIAGVLRRSPEKAQQTQQQHGVPAFHTLEDFLQAKPDFVVLAVPRSVVLKQLEALFQRQVPVLVETPPAANTEELAQLWQLYTSQKPVVMVAEQYFCQPYHSANLSLIQSGLLGQVHSASNGMMHGYHGISMLRKVLGIGMENAYIHGKTYPYSITQTCGRDGPITTGGLAQATRQAYTFQFESGKLAFWDFSDEQYFSYIRQRHFSVQGTRGEICDYDYHYLNEDNTPVSLRLQRDELGQYSNLEGYGLRGLCLGGKTVYQNPFPGTRLNDDEIAIATLMQNMVDHIVQGTPLLYPLKDALQDSYLALCLEAAFTEGHCQTQTQPWAQEEC